MGFSTEKNEDGKLRKQHWYVCPTNDGEFFAIAGLLAAWKSPEGQDIVTACVITTTSNEVMVPIYDRMPVLLQPEYFDAWLDPACRDVRAPRQCLLPAPTGGMVAWQVGSRVSSSKNEGPDLIPRSERPMAKES